MTGFRLIVMPYELGRLRDGVGRGPERLLEAGAVEALGSAGATGETGTAPTSTALRARLRAGQLWAIVSELLERTPVQALSLTAYDPEADQDGHVPPIALGLLRRLAAARG